MKTYPEWQTAIREAQQVENAQLQVKVVVTEGDKPTRADLIDLHEGFMVDLCAALGIPYEESTTADVLAAMGKLKAELDNAEPTPEMEANNQREISLNQAVAESLLALQKAKAENAQLRADLDAANGRLELFPEPILESFHYEGGKANLLLSHPVVAHIAADMATMFDETGGLNYATFEVLHKPTNRGFVFTIQLKTGLTPHQKEVAANARANALAADLQVATAAPHNIGIYPPTDGVFCCIDLDEVQVIARQALARLKAGGAT